MNWADALADVGGGTGAATEIKVFCQPRAARSAVVGLHGGAVKVKVRAPALEGRANDELVRLLAGALGVPPAAVALTAGAHSRWKRLVVSGVPAERAAALLEAGVGGPRRQ